MGGLGQLVGSRPGLRIRRAKTGAAYQGRLAEWTAQVDEGALVGQAEAEGVAVGLELAVPGLDLQGRSLGHGAKGAGGAIGPVLQPLQIIYQTLYKNGPSGGV